MGDSGVETKKLRIPDTAEGELAQKFRDFIVTLYKSGEVDFDPESIKGLVNFTVELARANGVDSYDDRDELIQAALDVMRVSRPIRDPNDMVVKRS